MLSASEASVPPLLHDCSGTVAARAGPIDSPVPRLYNATKFSGRAHNATIELLPEQEVVRRRSRAYHP
jgi:hypothetical protein